MSTIYLLYSSYMITICSSVNQSIASPLAPIKAMRAHSLPVITPGTPIWLQKSGSFRTITDADSSRLSDRPTDFDSTPEHEYAALISRQRASSNVSIGYKLQSTSPIITVTGLEKKRLKKERALQTRATQSSDSPLSSISTRPANLLTTSTNHEDTSDFVSIHMVFIAMALCGIFLSSTIILLILIICGKHSKKMFIKHAKRLNSITEGSTTNDVNSNKVQSIPLEDSYQQVQALQTRIINMLVHNYNTSIQHSNESFHNTVNVQNMQQPHEYAINTNNQQRVRNVSINPMSSPYHTNMPHQLHTFQISNNSNYSNSTNHNTEIVSPGITVDNNLFMEFLEFKRRQSLQQNYARRQSVPNPRHYR
eukprot:14221_1